MRNLVTSTGRRIHIVREMAFHSADGKLLFGLCGVWPKIIAGEPVVGGPDGPNKRRCKTCKRLYDNGAR